MAVTGLTATISTNQLHSGVLILVPLKVPNNLEVLQPERMLRRFSERYE